MQQQETSTLPDAVGHDDDSTRIACAAESLRWGNTTCDWHKDFQVLCQQDSAGIQACVAALTELLLEANGDAESEAGLRVSEVLTDWELVVGARRRYNMNGLREMFSQPPHALDPDCNLDEVKSAVTVLSCMFLRYSVLLDS